jgi:hypothetical protein
MADRIGAELLASSDHAASALCRIRVGGQLRTGLGLPLDGYRTTPPLITSVEVTVSFTTSLPGGGEYTEYLVLHGDGSIEPVEDASGVVAGFDGDYRDLVEALHGDLLLSTRLHSGLVEATGDISALSFAEGVISGRPFAVPPSSPELLAALRRFAAS